MHRWIFLSVAAASAFGQTTTYPYVVKDILGNFSPGDGGPALSAYLDNPSAALSDGNGNVYIADPGNFEIRVVTPDGNINSFTPLTVPSSPVLPAVYDMKRGKDGSLYVAAAGVVLKVSPAGVVTTFAGTGTPGFSGDGGPATSAQVGTVKGIALDAAGDVFIVESDQNRLRKIAVNGTINTIAGNGSPAFSGDTGPASAAQFNTPTGVAVDQAGNIYIADYQNRRLRKIGLDGNINTVAGDGVAGQPKDGTATTSPLGFPYAVATDSSNNVYFSDSTYGIVLKLTSDGNMKRIAGSYSAFGDYADGIATNDSFRNIVNISPDPSGNLYVTDLGTQRARELTTDGNVHTVAGALHDAGDGGPASAAIFYEPHEVAIDAQGDIFVPDSYNYYIRKITGGLSGTINAYAGNGVPGYPSNGSPALGSPIDYVYAMTMDSSGALYLASLRKVLKISAAGTFTTIAGTGTSGNTGDGGIALLATLQTASGVAVDAAGNVYVADGPSNRVRKITATTGIISPFAGTGAAGFSGDGSFATSAQLNFGGFLTAPLTIDKSGDVLIADVGNNRIRMVTPAGIISTVAGNGTAGHPTDGQRAASTALSQPQGIAVDSNGTLYIVSRNYGEIYSVINGVIQRIGGGGPTPNVDNAGGLATLGSFAAFGIHPDTNGDLFVSSGVNKIRELIPNPPVGLAVSMGNNQTGSAGAALANPLIANVMGQAGVGVPGVTVNFAVTSGSATLSAASVQTDVNGLASVTLTLGSTPGTVTVTATAPGLSPPSVQFTATVAAAGSCAVSAPSVTSVNSATDFGGFSTFTSGSWLEVKGSNLAPDTRQWGGTDFQGANAPTKLDGSSVSIHGNAGFVYYISSAQINVQAPADVTIGPVQLMVTNCAGTSAPVTVQKAALAAGLLAPAAFNIGGKQYLAAQFQDGTFVGNAGLISGVAFRPATPGDSLTVYGVGFGPVTPAIAPGVVVSQSNSIPGLTISFGQTPAATTYAGLSPGFVGLYQFDITVPNVQAGDYPINVSVGGVPVAQTFYLTVQ